MASMNTIVAIMAVLATVTIICQAYPESNLLGSRQKRQAGA